MTLPHGRKLTALARRKLRRRRRLHFECCEDRILLATIPTGNLLENVDVNMNMVPAEVVLQVATNSATESSNNAVNVPGTATVSSNTANSNGTAVTDAAVADALHTALVGEGAFEPLAVTVDSNGNQYFTVGDTGAYGAAPATYDTIYGDHASGQSQVMLGSLHLLSGLNFDFRLDTTANDVAVRNFDGAIPATLSLLDQQTVYSRWNDGAKYDETVAMDTIFGNGTTRRAPLIRLIGESQYFEISELVVDERHGEDFVVVPRDGYLANGKQVYRQGDDFTQSPPPMSEMRLFEVALAPPRTGESGHSVGEGEFVRLSVGTYSERIEVDRSLLVQVANPQPASNPTSSRQVSRQAHTANFVQPAVRHSGRGLNSVVHSAAWEMKLTPVSRVALSFDASDPSFHPNTVMTPSHTLGSSAGTPRSVPVRPADSSTSELPGAPKLNTISLRGWRPDDKRPSNSSPAYAALSPLIVLVSGSILVKDRWQKRSRANELAGLCVVPNGRRGGIPAENTEPDMLSNR